MTEIKTGSLATEERFLANMSAGARKIMKILKDNRISFRLEYEFSDLKGKKGVPLRFDFALFDAGALRCLIEYDGEAHFQQIKHFQKHRSDYLKACERDRVKNKYCLMNNIPLYRIPYFDIDSISSFQDLFKPEYKVKSKYHNDYIKVP